MCVLIVEDDLSSRMLIGQTLQRAGFEIVEAVDGAAALVLLQSRRFDFVILDLLLPRVKGVDIIRAIFADETLAKMPLLVFSAHEDLDGLQLRPQDRFLLKPASPRVISEIAQAFLSDLSASC
ncbi:MAG: response regulator [Chloroflexota bacterium]|nr:response regulator [Chloroflexota bacterium]